MIAVRVAESDADIEVWRRVRRTVLPDERAQTVAEMRAAKTTSSLYLLAELDSRGSGVADRSDLAGQGFLAPRVRECAEDSLSAVRSDWRRRGIALLLKRTVLAWAAEHGLRELYTWTQNGNAAMRAVNESLGYEIRSAGIRVRGRLPLPR